MTADEMLEAIREHHARHGYKSLLEHLEQKIEIFPALRREIIEKDYESRTEVWSQYLKDCMTLIKEEAVYFDLPLFEHKAPPDTRARRKPSLWSAQSNSAPQRVELAAAEFYAAQGYSVSFMDSFVVNVIGACIISAHFGKEESRNVLEGRLPQANQISYLQEHKNYGAGKKVKPYLVESINGQLSHWLRFWSIYYSADEARNLRSMGNAKRAEIIIPDFWKFSIFKSEKLDDLVDSLSRFSNHSDITKIIEIYIRQNVFNIRSGAPDLIIWNDEEFQLIEIKSPNDKLHKNQSEFYKYIMRPLGIDFLVGRVIPI